MNKEHVSYSEILTFQDCPKKWYLQYVDGHKSADTIHSVFGTFIHDAIHQRKVNNNNLSWISMGKEITKWILDNPIPDKWTAKIKQPNEWVTYKGYLNSRGWVRAAFVIYDQIFDWLERTFGEYELIGSEIRIKEPIHELNDTIAFKGFVDFLIKDKEGVYHLIDFKSTGWGWGKDKRQDTYKQYQITLYKKFACQTLDIDPKKVKTHFVLLKRQPSKKTNEACELITISSGPKKMENATIWATKNVKLMQEGFKMKKRGKCQFCDFHKTPLCP